MGNFYARSVIGLHKVKARIVRRLMQKAHARPLLSAQRVENFTAESVDRVPTGRGALDTQPQFAHRVGRGATQLQFNGKISIFRGIEIFVTERVNSRPLSLKLMKSMQPDIVAGCKH